MDKREMISQMTKLLNGDVNAIGIMWELVGTISAAVDADLFNLYLVESVGEITRYVPDNETFNLYD